MEDGNTRRTASDKSDPEHHLSLLVKWTGQLRAWQLHRVRIFHCDFSPRRKAFHSILPISFYSLPSKIKDKQTNISLGSYVSPDYRSQVEVRSIQFGL